MPLAVTGGFENEPLRRAIEIGRENEDSERLSDLGLVKASFEIILEDTEDEVRFNFIAVTLDAFSMNLKLGKFMATVNMDEYTARRIFAFALIYRVPVYPENQESVARLERLYRSVVDEGFEMEHDGERRRFSVNVPTTPSLASSLGEEFSVVDAAMQPIEHVIAEARSTAREIELAEAERVLGRLQSAIETFESILCSEETSERDLHNFLERSTFIFGLQYKRALSEFQLGGEYRADFVLEKVDGLVDPVELESHKHKLYRRDGSPTAALTHAEQQVLDWLEWFEEHAEYGRSRLPGLRKPRGIVIIGRSTSLTSNDRIRLRRRNLALRDSMAILTYDDLLDEAKNMLIRLQGTAGSFASAND